MKIANVCLVGLVFVVCASAEPLLEGRVRLDSGEPVADAQVQIFDLTDLRQGAVARAQTDGAGYFSLPLAALGGRALPARFALGPNYPNPFNPSTTIPYQLAASSEVRLEVFNLLGQRITTLVDGERAAGFHTATWHAVDGTGRAVGAGVYIYRMTVEAERQTGRMVLLDGQAGVAAAGTASVMPSAAGVGVSNEAEAQVYGLIVSGRGLAPYVDSSFQVEGDMAPVELVVSSGSPSAGKAMDDDCAFCDLFDAFNDQQDEKENETTEEEGETESTSSEGGPDLIVQSPSVSATMLTPGQAFTLQATVHNQGDAQAAATMLHYYRSNNSTISSSDTEVGTDAIDALDASATSAQSIALTASAGVERYYGACVASVGGESNTDNNCSSAVKITVSGQETSEEVDETTEKEVDETPEGEEEDTPEEEGADTPVTIPDAKLRAAIEKALGKARRATITHAEMKDLTRLEVHQLSISSVSGLESATNLRDLGLFANNVSDVSPLAGLTNLKDLNLASNNISDVSPLRGLTNLTNLVLGNNNISDVSPLTGLTNLKELYLYGNNISDVSPLRGLTNLKDLYLGGNNISDVSPLAGLTNLTYLTLGNNNISDVSPLRGLTNLPGLYLGDNNISDMSPFAGLTNLRDLYLDSNNISDVSPLRGLTNLTLLYIRGNHLNVSSINDHIPALKRSGATVLFDSFLESDFDIELVFLSTNFSERQKRNIQYAARRWMSIIREDLPDYTLTTGWSGTCGDLSYAIPAGERIDDLRIYVISSDDHKNFGPIGAWASIIGVREDPQLPVLGCMAFSEKSYSTALHEIGHVLGIGGTFWSDRGFIQDRYSAPHFNGPRAIAAFNNAGGRNYTGKKVPVDSDLSHWSTSVLSTELMWGGGATWGRLSAITIQALADIGYPVDVTQADPYTLRRFAAAKASAKVAAPFTHAEPEFSCGTGQQQGPIYVVDQQGRIIRTLGDR